MLRARFVCAALLAATGACGGPVEWKEPVALAAAPTEGATLTFGAGDAAAWGPAPAPPASLPAVQACPGTLRVARLVGNEWYAIWWQVRPDSSASLEGARSTDGGASWPERAAVDTTDRSIIGCRRPAPALATDSASQYVHTAYWLVAPEGAGVFFSHSMPGHFMFHAPVPVMYGERPSRAAVAASGNFVVVAYEDPNATDPEVWIAISRTQGHLFDERVSASSGGGAVAPRVALRGTRIAVAWERKDRVGAPPSVAGSAGQFLVRMGEVKR